MADAILTIVRSKEKRQALSQAGVKAARLFRRESQADEMLALLENCARAGVAKRDEKVSSKQ